MAGKSLESFSSLPEQKRHIDQVFRSGRPQRSTEYACGFSANFSFYPRLIRLLAGGETSFEKIGNSGTALRSGARLYSPVLNVAKLSQTPCIG
jgi:hypothetical protein